MLTPMFMTSMKLSLLYTFKNMLDYKATHSIPKPEENKGGKLNVKHV